MPPRSFVVHPDRSDNRVLLASYRFVVENLSCSVWNLIAEDNLAENISSWILDINFA